MAGKDEFIQVRCSAAEKLWLKQAADSEGASLSAWLMALARERAEEVLVGADEPAASFLPGFGLMEE